MIRAMPRALLTAFSKDSFLQTLNCAINRQNYIDMGGNGEDTRAYTAGRIRIPKSSQEHVGIHPAGGRPAGPVQVAESAGQVGLATVESVRLLQCSQGKTVKFHRAIHFQLSTVKFVA